MKPAEPTGARREGAAHEFVVIGVFWIEELADAENSRKWTGFGVRLPHLRAVSAGGKRHEAAWHVYLVEEGMEFASDVANDEELDCV